MRYAVVVEKSASGFGAYAPDLPSCIAVAESKEEVIRQIQEAVTLHIESMKADGEAIPPPSSDIAFIEVAA